MNSTTKTMASESIFSRIRRNHGLEHATIHFLTQGAPNRKLAGHSDAGGFWLWGNVSAEEVDAAVHQALDRLRQGEHHLALHPNCGTNYLASGMAAGLAGALAMFGAGRHWRDKLERLPLAGLFATVALIFAQPLGFKLQERVTTSGNPGELEIVAIKPTRQGRIIGYRVITQG